jgi:hypothetical protein
MLIRLQIPGVKYAIEFDSDKIAGVELPLEIAGVPGRKEHTGQSSLILHFAALDDRPKWVE